MVYFGLQRYGFYSKLKSFRKNKIGRWQTLESVWRKMPQIESG